VRYLETLREAIAGKPFIIRRVGRRDDDATTRPIKNNSVTVTVSIGFADSSGSKTSPWDVLKQSDKALYRAKGKGRNCVSE
jgi:diguanylate cyclase (GGDEF)-like protein